MNQSPKSLLHFTFHCFDAILFYIHSDWGKNLQFLCWMIRSINGNKRQRDENENERTYYLTITDQVGEGQVNTRHFIVPFHRGQPASLVLLSIVY